MTGDAEVLEDHEVSIDGFAFIPQDLEIVAGDRVRWTNNQAGANHTVTDDAGGFGSPVLATGEMFEVEFPEPLPDPVNYHCEIHPFMTGTVTVTPPG
ncbi:MAG: plastocyanin/azurin family copper-binding protein [Natronosporangium sp.]